jgi:hypothetical protein
MPLPGEDDYSEDSGPDSVCDGLDERWVKKIRRRDD